MLIIVYLLLVPVVVGLEKVKPADFAVVSSVIDPLTDQSSIDETWVDYMITAPVTINLLGRVMVVASKTDVSFDHYSPNHVYKYIKYPKSFRATLLQISNEGYRAFLGAHTSMNKIQLYMRQIPGHIKTIVKILSSNASPKLVSRLLPITTNNIERIGKTCVTLAHSTEDSFLSVMNLLDEVIEVTEVTKGLHEKETRDKEIELNVTRDFHASMKQEEERRRQAYEEVRQSVRKAQEEYSRALDDIPTGFKALALELGRAAISVLKSFAQAYIAKKTGGLSLIQQQGSKSDGVQSFATEQIISFAAHFAQSLNSLIERLSSNENQTVSDDELRSYKVVFGTFANMINNIPNNKLKNQATNLVQRAVKLVDTTIENKNATIIDQLKTLANDIKPFMAAEQLSSTNNAPISAQTEGDLSKNEVLKAQLAQVRLAQTEKRLDEHFAGHMAAMEQMRILSAKLTSLDPTVIHFKEILEMLRETFKLLGQLREKWSQLVLLFKQFSAKVVTGFEEKLKSFLDTSRVNLDFEKSEVDRIIMLELLNGDSINLHHESYLLFIMSRTYFDVSKKYLMPRLGGLSLMLAATNDDERKTLLNKLERDTDEVQAEVKQLVNERRETYQRVISEKRAEFNEKIDDQGADGDEDNIIEKGKRLLGYEDTLNK